MPMPRFSLTYKYLHLSMYSTTRTWRVWIAGTVVWCLSSHVSAAVEYHIDYAELYRYQNESNHSPSLNHLTLHRKCITSLTLPPSPSHFPGMRRTSSSPPSWRVPATCPLFARARARCLGGTLWPTQGASSTTNASATKVSRPCRVPNPVDSFFQMSL